MNKAIIGKKIGMSQVFTPEGVVIPVTVVEAGPCAVVQIKNKEKDGYNAIQMAFKKEKKNRINKPTKGHYAKSKAEVAKHLKEFRLDDCSKYKLGDVIKCDVFEVGEKVDVQGYSKGHGFSGPIKRWGFHLGPMAHGSGYHRGVGGIGACSYPGRVFKNRKMAGQYGNEKVTIQNLEIIKVLKDNNLLLIKGGIPGARNSIVFIEDTYKKAKRGK